MLAAGASSRMGEPKQLLPFEGETLLRRAVRVALETPYRPVIVVLGSHANSLLEEVAATDARIVINEAWAEGMSSSIRCGLGEMEAAAPEELDAAILMLCDQPFVSDEILKRLANAYQSRQALLVASEYESKGERIRGVPALFSRRLFPELMELRGAEGARHVVARHAMKASFIPVPEAAFDVDTPEDYRALKDSMTHDSEAV